MRYTSDDLEALRELSMTRGWELLQQRADEVVKSYMNGLLSVDATDTAKVAALQGEIRGTKWVFEHVKAALRRSIREED